MASAQNGGFENVDRSMIDLGDMILIMSPDEIEDEMYERFKPVISKESTMDIEELSDFEEWNIHVADPSPVIVMSDKRVVRPTCTRSVVNVVDWPPKSQPSTDLAIQLQVSRLQQYAGNLQSRLSDSLALVITLEEKLLQKEIAIKSLTDDLTAEREISACLRLELEQRLSSSVISTSPGKLPLLDNRPHQSKEGKICKSEGDDNKSVAVVNNHTIPLVTGASEQTPASSASVTPACDGEQIRLCQGCGANCGEIKSNSLADKLKGGVSTFFQNLKREVNNFIDEEEDAMDATKLETAAELITEQAQPRANGVDDRSESLRQKISERRTVVVKNMGVNERKDKCPYCSQVFPFYMSKQDISAHLNQHVDAYCSVCQSKFNSLSGDVNRAEK